MKQGNWRSSIQRTSAWVLIQALVVSQIVPSFALAQPTALKVEAPGEGNAQSGLKDRLQTRTGLEENGNDDGPADLTEAIQEWFKSGSSRQDELAFQDWLTRRGEQVIHGFVKTVLPILHLSSIEEFGAYTIPMFDPETLPAPHQMSGPYPIPSSTQEFESERLRLMAHVALRRAFGHLRHKPIKVVVNVGLGFVGTAVTIVTAASERYAAIAYQRPSTESSQKVNLVNEGKMPVKTADQSAPQRLRAAVYQGYLTATFLRESLAVADLIMLETELHFRKYDPRAIDQGESSPEASLELMRQVGAVMQPGATVLIESTVPPGFTEKQAWPVLTEALKDKNLRNGRPVLPEGEKANLAYAFQRLEPGPRWIQSLYEHKRIGAALTSKSRRDLEEYFQWAGFYSWEIWSDVSSVEALKDVENAYRIGQIEVAAAFLGGIERLGGNAWRIFAEIAADREPTHGSIIFAPAIQEGQGYCTPKELGELTDGLRQNFRVSDLTIKRIFSTRIDAIALSDHRAENYAYWLMGALDDLGLTLADSKVLVAGASYKPGVGDTRWTGAERLIRLLAHYGASVRATDPYVRDWPEFRRQRILDPESWAYRLHNQERLKDLPLKTVPTLYEALNPGLHAVVLATRHWQYVGRHQMEFLRTLDLNNPVHRQWKKMFDGIEQVDGTIEGLDSVKVAARMMGVKGRIIIDTFNFLSDQDIKEFLALGWIVLGSGKGHILRLAQEITTLQRLAIHRRLLTDLSDLEGVPGIVELDRQSALRAVQAEIRVLEAKVNGTSTGLEESNDLLDAQAKLETARNERRYAVGPQLPVYDAQIEFYAAKIRYLETRLGIRAHGKSSVLKGSMEQKKETLDAVMERQREGVVSDLTRDVLGPVIRKVRASLERAGQELTALSGAIPLQRPPTSAREVAETAQALLELADRVAGLRRYLDALVEETLGPKGKTLFWESIQRQQNRPALSVPTPRTELGGQVLIPDTIPLFEGTYPVGDEFGPPYYTRGPDERLHRVPPHPWNQTPYNSLTLKMVPDLAEDPAKTPQAWGRFSIQTPLLLTEAVGPSGAPVIDGFEAYPGMFDRLPLEFQRWLLQDVLGRGLVPTTMEGRHQEKVALVMQVNLQITTPARGRGGLFLDWNTRQPLTLVDEEGREWLLDVKALGPYGGGNPTTLDYNENRVVSGGRDRLGRVAQSRLGQLLGFQEDWSEINNLWLLRGTEAWEKGWCARPVFLMRFQFKNNPQYTLAMVGRAVPTNERLGQSHIGQPEYVANRIGWNTAEILHYPMAAVHIALIADNIMSNGYATDMGSLIWLHNERDPRGALAKYGGWSMQIPLFPFAEMKRDQFSQPRGEYLIPWVAGFRERFLESRTGLDRVRNPRRFEALLDPKNTKPKEDPNGYIDDLIHALWQYYLPWELLRERLEYGYDPTRESSYTQTTGTSYAPDFRATLIKDKDGKEWGIVGPEHLSQLDETGKMRVQIRGTDQEREVTAAEFSEETVQEIEELRKLPERRASEFIQAQRDLLQIAERLIRQENYPDLRFDFERAYRILWEKESGIKPAQTSYADVYDLSAIYPPKKPQTIPIISNLSKMANGMEPVRIAQVKLAASIMNEKVGVENVVIGRRGKPKEQGKTSAGLEEKKLGEVVDLNQVRVEDPKDRTRTFSNAPVVFVSIDAGKGSRFESSGPGVAKVLAPLRGFPLGMWAKRSVETVLNWPIIAVVGHRAEEVMETYTRHSKNGIVFVHSENTKGGTGYALYHAKAVLKDHPEVLVVATVGDQPLYDADLFKRAVDEFQKVKPEPDLVIGTVEVKEPAAAQRKGRIVRDSSGHILAILEQSDINVLKTTETRYGFTREQLDRLTEINGSIYVMRARQLDLLAELTNRTAQGEYYVTDLVKMISSGGGKVVSSPIEPSKAADVTTWQDLQRLEQQMAGLEEAPPLSQWISVMDDPGRAQLLLAPHYSADVITQKRQQLVRWLDQLHRLKTTGGEPAFALDRPTVMNRTPGRAPLPPGGRHLDYIGMMGGSLGFPTLQETVTWTQVVDGLPGIVEVYAMDSPDPAVLKAFEGGPRRISLSDPNLFPPKAITSLAQWDAWAAQATKERRETRAPDSKVNYADDLVAAVIAFLRTDLGDPSGRARDFFNELTRQGKGLRIAFASDLPPGGGLSSSSSLLEGAAQSFNQLAGIRLDTAALIHEGYAERFYNGTQGGVKDHAHMMYGAAFLGVEPVRKIQDIPVLPETSLLLLDSGISRDNAPRYSAKLQQPGDDEQNIKSRTGIGYALGVLWIRHSHPELAERLRPDQDPSNPYGFLRELVPGTAHALTLKETYRLLREIPAEGFTQEQLYAALPEFKTELDGLFHGRPTPPRPYPLREALLFGFAEETRNWETARILKQLEQGVSADAVFGQLCQVIRHAHDGDRVSQHRIEISPDGQLRIQEKPWDWRMSDERLDWLMGHVEEPEAALWAQSGWMERSIEPVDQMVDTIEFFNRQNGGRAAVGEVIGAGLGGTVCVIARNSYVPSLSAFLEKYYYGPLQLTHTPPVVAQPGQAAGVFDLFPSVTAGLEEGIPIATITHRTPPQQMNPIAQILAGALQFPNYLLQPALDGEYYPIEPSDFIFKILHELATNIPEHLPTDAQETAHITLSLSEKPINPHLLQRWLNIRYADANRHPFAVPIQRAVTGEATSKTGSFSGLGLNLIRQMIGVPEGASLTIEATDMDGTRRRYQYRRLNEPVTELVPTGTQGTEISINLPAGIVSPQAPPLAHSAEQILRGVAGIQGTTAAVKTDAGLEEKIQLQQGATLGQVIFLGPEVATEEIIRALDEFKPAAGERIRLVVFASDPFHADQVKGWLKFTQLRALEVVDVKTVYDGDLDRAIDMEQIRYLGDPEAGVEHIHIVRTRDDLAELEPFLKIPGVSFRSWQERLTERQLGSNL